MFLKSHIQLPTCITRSNKKLRGRPKTVKISPRLSSIQRIIFFFSQLVSSMLFENVYLPIKLDISVCCGNNVSILVSEWEIYHQ